MYKAVEPQKRALGSNEEMLKKNKIRGSGVACVG